MMTVRRSQERGQAHFGWLQSQHTFSFGGYHNPEYMGFGPLRVINEDRVAPSKGFGKHGHRDMEIISYVLDGELEHRDSMGNGSVIRPGDVQRMSAGTGVLHSEMNPSPDKPAHFLQIWILPQERGLEPSYEQKHFPADERTGVLRLVASRDGRDGSITVHQDVDLYAGLFEPGTQVSFLPDPGRKIWLQVARGGMQMTDIPLSAGDGAAVASAQPIVLTATEQAEVLLFDMGSDAGPTN